MAESFLGEIRILTGQNVPTGWMLCNGQQMNVSDQPALFSLIGSTYGGNGSTTFNLPNLQGLLVAGVGQGTGMANNYTLGQTFGAYAVTLSADQAAHSHALQASNSPATSTNPAGAFYAAPPANYAGYISTTTSPTLRQLDPAMLANTGANLPHDNLMPSVAFNYIICISGLYPNFN